MTELVHIDILSAYKSKGAYVNLGSGMAKCTPDFRDAIYHIRDDVQAAGGVLRLSDLFRSYETQKRIHDEYKAGKRAAYTAAPGSSYHEAGRAMDIDVAALKPLGANYLEVFWKIAAKYGVVPIISEPNPSKSECWHFECRGEFQTVRELQGYAQSVRAAILDVGLDVHDITDDAAAWAQGQILAYGINIGPIDGIIGKGTKAAIRTIKQTRGWPKATLVPATDVSWEAIDEWLIVFLDTLKVRAA